MEENKNNDELLKLYAQFLINFEHVSHLMRFTILHIIFPKHTYKQTRQNEILMESLTADQIRRKFMALVVEDYKFDSEIFKLSKAISDCYERTIPLRNSFAHGTSFIGASPSVKDSQDGRLILRHPKLKKEGLDLNFKKYEIETLKLGIQLFEKLRQAVTIVAITVQNVQNNELDSKVYDANKYMESTREAIEQIEHKLQTILK